MTVRPVAATLNNSCSSWAKNVRSPSGSATYWKLPPPASAMALSSPSSKSCPDADRGRGDAAPPQLARVPRQHPRIENADIGQPIGEQDDAPDARCRGIRIGDGRRLGKLMATGDPAAGEVRRAAGIDAVQREPQTRLEPGRRRRQRLHGIDLIVVDDQRRAVGVPQPRDGQIDPLLGEVQFAALHRPGAVEDERDVEGRRATRSQSRPRPRR